MTAVEVAAGVWRFTVPLAMPSPDHLHVHVLRLLGRDLIVDTGARGSEKALRAGLAAAAPRAPRVLITHGHVDHWGLATTLAPTVLAHPGCEMSLRFAAEGAPKNLAGSEWADADGMRRAFSGFAKLVAGVPAIEPLADGDRFDDEWEVLWTPGHDPGHVCLWRASDGVLLCGDLLLPGYTPNIQPGFDGGDALGDFLASLARIEKLPVKLVLPAHGEPYTDAAGRARELRDHHLRRLSQLVDAVSSGVGDVSELSRRLFGSAVSDTPADRMLAVMETYAHLEHLRVQGRAVTDADNRWQAAT
jgi:glyoxylase-like metal-dependent hydrolase (beta-lactamase superfamily II)